jgi:Co/Zn/Cd efflux system component
MSQQVPVKKGYASYKRRSLQSPLLLDKDKARDQNSDANVYNTNTNTDSESEVEMDYEPQMRTLNDTNPDNNHLSAGLTLDRANMSSSSLHSNGVGDTSLNSYSINSPSKQEFLSNPSLNMRPSMSGHGRTNRYSLQAMNSPAFSGTAGKSHRRSTSTASSTYIPSGPIEPPKPFAQGYGVGTRTPPISANQASFGNGGISPSPSITISNYTMPDSVNNSPKRHPFKFGSLEMNNSSENLTTPGQGQGQGSPQVLPKASYRRGHRYKHSSVSMNMFQDSERIASMSKPHNHPQRYPIPTFGEVVQKISPNQKKKIMVCCLQVVFALATYLGGFHYSNSCLSTLAHIMFYDVISNISSITIQVMSNFDVWKLSSLKYPFGLGRIEVLSGFALSVSLLFVGLDLFSHIAEEFLISSLVDTDTNVGEQAVHSGHGHGSNEISMQNHPILYECFIITVIIVTILTSQVVHGNDNATASSGKPASAPSGVRIASNLKRLSSITLKEPPRESFWQRCTSQFQTKLGINPKMLGSTTGLSLFYAIYSLYYPFAMGILHFGGIGHSHEGENGGIDHQADKHEDDALEATEWINSASMVLMAVLVSIVAWRLIWRLGNILLLGSPSAETSKGGGEDYTNVERLIEQNVAQLDVFRSSYRIEEVKVARMNTKVYVVILRVHMPGVSDDEESKFRFYAMRIVRGVMFQAVKGQLHANGVGVNASTSASASVSANSCDDSSSAVDGAEAQRRSLIDLLNLAASTGDLASLDSTGDVFEVTVSVSRL